MLKVRFQALADLRRRHQDECRKKLGQLERHRMELIERRQAISDERAAAGCDVRPGFHEVFAQYWMRVEHVLTLMAKDQAMVEAQIEKARNELAEAHREVRTVDKLQERDRLAHQRVGERRERRRNDEFAGYRYAAMGSGDMTP